VCGDHQGRELAAGIPAWKRDFPRDGVSVLGLSRRHVPGRTPGRSGHTQIQRCAYRISVPPARVQRDAQQRGTQGSSMSRGPQPIVGAQVGTGAETLRSIGLPWCCWESLRPSVCVSVCRDRQCFGTGSKPLYPLHAVQGAKPEQPHPLDPGGIWGQFPPASIQQQLLPSLLLLGDSEPSAAQRPRRQPGFACKVLIIIVATTTLFLGRCLKEPRK